MSGARIVIRPAAEQDAALERAEALKHKRDQARKKLRRQQEAVARRKRRA